MKKERFLRQILKRSERSENNSQSLCSTVYVRKSNHHLSKFGDIVNQLSTLEQSTNKIEEVQKSQYTRKRFIYGKIQYPLQRQMHYFKLLYQGLNYSTLVLGSPSEEYLNQKKLLLPEEPNNQKKFLILDLDQTLIHTVDQGETFDCQVYCQGDPVRFNVRPFCEMFLDAMSQHFQIYIFSSAIQEYIRPIVDYLNFNKRYIKGFLSRHHCFQTNGGMWIKDLRIIKNRDISQIVMIDNLVHSFGLQLENGIPILQFKDQKNDRQLLGLQSLLLELKKVADIRVYLQQKLGLMNCLNYSEEEFVHVKKSKNFMIKKRATFFL